MYYFVQSILFDVKRMCMNDCLGKSYIDSTTYDIRSFTTYDKRICQGKSLVLLDDSKTQNVQQKERADS